MQAALRLLDKEAMDKQRALEAALGQIERAFGKGSIMKLGSHETRGRHRGDLDRLARARHRARHRRVAARPGRRDLRAGELGQDHPGLARHRRGAARRRHLRLYRRRARARPGLCPQARGQCRRSADLAARCRRAGARNHRHPGPLGRDRCAGHRFGRGAGAARRARRRDGRQPYGSARPADEPGLAQIDRLDLAVAGDRHLHQSDPPQDRRHVRQSRRPRPAATRSNSTPRSGSTSAASARSRNATR